VSEEGNGKLHARNIKVQILALYTDH